MPKFNKYKARRSVRKAYKKAGFGKPSKGRFTKRKAFKKRKVTKRPVRSVIGLSDSYVSAGGRKHKAHKSCYQLPEQNYLVNSNGVMGVTYGANQQATGQICDVLTEPAAVLLVNAAQNVINNATGGTTPASNVSTIYLNKAHLSTVFTNSSVCPVEMDLYVFKPKRSTSNGITTEWTNGITAAQPNPLDLSIIVNTYGQGPLDYQYFKTQYALVKKKTVFLAGGQSHSFKMSVKYGHNVTEADFGGAGYAAKRTLSLFAVTRPVSVTGSGNTGHTALAPVLVDYFNSVKYSYRIPTAMNLSNADYTETHATIGTAFAVAQGGSVFTTTL